MKVEAPSRWILARKEELSMKKRLCLVVGNAVFLLASIGCGLGSGAGDYQALVDLNNEFIEFRRPVTQDGLPDYTPATIDKQKADLESFAQRLSAIDPTSWPVSQKVDYLLVRAQTNRLDFDHRARRPWSRDPGLYVDAVQGLAFQEFPLEGEELAQLETQLGGVPAFLEQAKENLTEGGGELTKLALRNLVTADGVGHGHPYRETPPAGTIGWYQDLIVRLEQHHQALVQKAKEAHAAVKGFHRCLQENQNRMKTPSGVGRDNYDWYLKYVAMMPFTWDDVNRIGDRELHRSWTFLELERNKNRNLPTLEPATSAEDYAQRIRDADEHIRKFIVDMDILTIPDYVGEFGQNVPWIVRAGGRRNFWEEVQYRDPRPDHVHAVIPGHRFDGLIRSRDERPIRGTYRDRGRSEGWGFYLEEMMLQAGLLDELPRTRELYYIFQIARAVRNRSEALMHTEDFTVQDAVDYMLNNTPFMDEDVARVDAEIYLKTPGSGIAYQMGKIQLEALMADRAAQLGDDFNLREFHDEFLAAGTIPISLIRWEMTGYDDEVKDLFEQPET